jgi:hypothetical protein
MTLENATLIFLVLIFVAAEILRSVRSRPGVIVSVEEGYLGPVLLPLMKVNVRLERGDEVSASLNCCTLCLGHLKLGDEVRVSPSREGYVVDLPWFRSGKCRDTGKACQYPAEMRT